MCVAHCDAVGYIALRGVIMNNEELALRIQQGEDVKKEYAAAIRSELLFAAKDSEEIQ